MPKNLIRKLPDGFEWKIEWEQDHPQDSSWMGDWSRNSFAGPYWVDTKRGELKGQEGKEILMEVGKDNENFFEESLGWIYEATDGEHDWLFTEDKGETALYTRDDYVIRSGLPTYHGDRSDRRFWYPSDMRFSKNCEKEIAEFGLDEVIKWIIGDYERHLAYAHNEWTFEYCLVKLVHEDFPDDMICWNSLGGVESDRTKEYQTEVEEDCMWEAINLEEVNSFIKGHADDGTFGDEDYQAVIAEFAEWEIAVKAQRQAAYDAQRAAWEAQKNEQS